MTVASKIPGPKGGLRLGLSLRDNGPATLTELYKNYGDIVGFSVGRRRIVLLNHPEYAYQVFVGAAHKYAKSRGAKKVRSLLGEGLLTSEGEVWRRSRSVIQPLFTQSEIRRQVPLIQDVLAEISARWVAPPGEGTLARAQESIIDLHKEMTRLTVTVAARALFSTEVDEHVDVFRDAFRVAFEHVVKRLHALVDLPPEVFPTPTNLKFRRAVRQLDAIVEGILEKRRSAGAGACGQGKDLLASLLEAARDSGDGAALSERQLRDEILTLILGGYDTSANTLTWAFYLLSQHPQLLAELRAEADPVFAHGPVDAGAVKRLQLSQMVFEETMRLYPPVWVLAREARVDDEIGGHVIEAGTMILVSPFVMHRLPTIWEDPLSFRPERFRSRERSLQPRFSYIPFGGGQRHCLGRLMALQEGTLAIAYLAHAFDFEPVDRGEPAFSASITLAPRDGLPVRVQRRERGRSTAEALPTKPRPEATLPC
jgi:cytochrome P450